MSTSMIREMYCGGPEQGTNIYAFFLWRAHNLTENSDSRAGIGWAWS